MKAGGNIPGRPVQSKARLDAMVLLAFACILYVFFLRYDAFDKIAMFAERYEAEQLDEILSLLIFLSFALIIYGYRRWMELRKKAIELENTLQAFRDAELLLEKVFDSLADAILVIDANTRNIMACNSGVRRVFGYSENELKGRNISILHVNNESYEDFGRMIFPALEDKGLFQAEFQLRRKDGQIFHTEHRATALNDDKGNRIGVVSVVRDIEARKNMESSIDKYVEQLKILREMDKEILTSRSPVEIAKTVLAHFIRLIPGVRASVLLFDPTTSSAKVLAVASSAGTTLGQGADVPLTGLGDLMALAQGKVQVVEDIVRLPQGEPTFQALMAEGIRSYLVVPIVSHGLLVGTINLGRGHSGAFNEDEVELGQEVAGALAIGIQQALLLESLENQRKNLRALGARLVDLEETDRKRLAAELHDRIGANITALGFNLSAIKNALDSDMPESAHARVSDCQTLLGEMADVTRNVMADLRPNVLDEYGLETSIRWYCERFSQRTGIMVEVHSEEIAPRPSAAVETTFFRIAQEALTNIFKHAQSKTATVVLKQGNGRIRLIIADHGTGFDTSVSKQQEAGSGWGLSIMHERALSVGGRLEIESVPGRGTRIQIDWEF